MRLFGGSISITVFPLTSGSREVELSSSRMVEPASRRGTGCLESQWPVASSQAVPHQMQLRLLRNKWAVSLFQNSYIWRASPKWSRGWLKSGDEIAINDPGCQSVAIVLSMALWEKWVSQFDLQPMNNISFVNVSVQIQKAGSRYWVQAQCVRVFHFSAAKILFCELLSCCERVKVILESGVWPQESSGLCIACNLSMWEGVWRQFLVNVTTFDSFESSKMMRRQDERFHFWGKFSKFERCASMLCVSKCGKLISWQKDESSWWLWLSLPFMSCDRGN